MVERKELKRFEHNGAVVKLSTHGSQDYLLELKAPRGQDSIGFRNKKTAEKKYKVLCRELELGAYQ